MKEHEIIEIIAKFLANEASDLEKETLTKWRKIKIANEIYFKQFETIWQNINDSNDKIDIESAWENIVPKLTTKAPILKLNFMFKMAAAVTLVLSLSILVVNFYLTTNQLVVFEKKSEKQKIELPDGSIVWLNNHSNLTYVYGNNERNITLNGEAFFEVAKNPKKPFIIKSKNAVTKVLGTSFNLAAFDSLETVKLSVSAGMVNFKSTKTNSEQILIASESAIINANGKNYKLPQFDINEVVWKENKLIFNNVSLNEAMAAIAHYYGVKITTDNVLLSNCHITCQFENATLIHVLDNISMILSITYTKNNNIIILSGKGCN